MTADACALSEVAELVIIVIVAVILSAVIVSFKCRFSVDCVCMFTKSNKRMHHNHDQH